MGAQVKIITIKLITVKKAFILIRTKHNKNIITDKK